MTEETNHEPDWPEDLREGQELAECIASAFGDFQGLINTTLENDSNSRERRKSKIANRTKK